MSSGFVYQNIIIGDTLTIRNGSTVDLQTGSTLALTDSTVTGNGTTVSLLNPAITASNGTSTYSTHAITLDSTSTLTFATGTSLIADPGSTIVTNVKGSLITGDGLVTTVLPVGADGQVVFANSAQTNGLEWRQVQYSDITGIVPLENGGTNVDGAATFVADRILATNDPLTGVITTSLQPNQVVTLTDVQTLSNKTLADPIIDDALLDTASQVLVQFPNPVVATAVNYVELSNAATAVAPSLAAAGADADINLNLNAKGTGNVALSGLRYPNADGTLNQVLATDGAGLLSFVSVPIVTFATLQTTDATTTLLSSVPIPTDAGSLITVNLISRQVGGNDTKAFVYRVLANNIAGTASVVVLDQIDSGAPAWLLNVAASGANVEFSVTGAAATTVNWRANINELVQGQ